jgi:aminopeptidase YwaD
MAKPSRVPRRAFVAMFPAAVVLLLAAALISACDGGAVTTTASLTPTTLSTGPSAPATTTSSATTSTSAAPVTTEPLAPTTTATLPPSTSATSTNLAFDSSNAVAHIQELSVGIGIRHAGTDAEMAAVDYARGHLEDWGYDVQVVDVPIPNGLTSHNTIAVKPGTSPLTIVVGAHIDSWGPSPGANDNASGAATVLELARDLQGDSLTPTIVFVLFGNEEMIDDNPDHHHYGSRAYVAQMSAQERTDLVGMISLDMVGYGNTFAVRTLGEGPQELRALVKAYAGDVGTAIRYVQDPAPAGWSDHEPFERAGYPAVWLEWRLDTTHHTPNDTIGHVSAKRLQATGDFMLGFLRGLDASALETLAEARTAK